MGQSPLPATGARKCISGRPAMNGASVGPKVLNQSAEEWAMSSKHPNHGRAAGVRDRAWDPHAAQVLLVTRVLLVTGARSLADSRDAERWAPAAILDATDGAARDEAMARAREVPR